MVASGDYIQWKDYQTLTGVDGSILNVFYMRVDSITATQPLYNIQEFLRDWYYDTVLAPTLAMQSNQVLHTYSEVNNLEAFTTDFATIIPEEPVAGTFPGEYLAPATAWTFQLVRQFRTTRHGSKRIAGVPEGLASNNIPSSAARILSDDVRLMWNELPVIELGGGETMAVSLVIPKTPTPPATIPTVFNNVTAVLFRGIGSQNSRKQLRPS